MSLENEQLPIESIQSSLNNLNINPETTQQTTTSKYIKTYTAENNLFGLSFQSSKDLLTLATSTMNISTNNKIEIIEYDTDKHVAGDIDKQPLPIINDIVIEELLMFITQI